MAFQPVPKRVLVALGSLCRAGWRAEEFVPALLEALHGVIPSARNLFDWTDDKGRLAHYFIEGPVDTAVAQLYFEEFHNRRETACMPAFSSLVNVPMGVRGAAELDRPEFFASALYNEVWRPQGFHKRIEGVVRGRGGQLLGSLVLYRGAAERSFSKQEEALLASFLPMVADALERPPALASACGPELHVAGNEPTETLVLNSQGQPLHASAGFERLLMLADGGLSRDALQRPMVERLERMLGGLVKQLIERARQPIGVAVLQPSPSVVLVNAFGRFDAHGSVLRAAGSGPGHDSPNLHIALRRLEPRAVALHRVLRSLPISGGQAAVCAALYAGQPQTEIARNLGVALTTVVDHARKLYRTLDVSGRNELRDYLDQRIHAAA